MKRRVERDGNGNSRNYFDARHLNQMIDLMRGEKAGG
jgi:hypothetical protein